VRPVFKVLLAWALSPLGTILNAAGLAAMLLLAGADPHRLVFWLPLALFVGVAAFYDIAAYLAQRRKGLSSAAIADAVFERLWPSPSREGSDHPDG
jgi:hypothetical protein